MYADRSSKSTANKRSFEMFAVWSICGRFETKPVNNNNENRAFWSVKTAKLKFSLISFISSCCFFLSLVEICDKIVSRYSKAKLMFWTVSLFYVPLSAWHSMAIFFVMIHQKLCYLWWVLRCTVFRLPNLTFQYMKHQKPKLECVFVLVVDSVFCLICTSH